MSLRRPAATSHLPLLLVLLGAIGLVRPAATLASFGGETASPANAFASLVVEAAVLGTPSASGGTVSLAWSASPTAASEAVTYSILRAAAGSGAFASVGTTTSLAFQDAPPDGRYDYVVRAQVSSFSRDSAARAALSDATAPTPATDLAATTGSATGSVDLAWVGGTDATAGVAGYEIRHVAAGKCPAASPSAYPGSSSVGAVTSATIAGLAKGNTCFYLVTIDGVGNRSAPSDVADARAK